ncbi:uncharacterized protein C8A04DRAFT_40044 [Dichotomopilus funicola]|uniref:NAD(P)-binding protein n=1 Tax=Dichotomopilus funicola TaxID=1934379 RepID=A0AAN6UW07_9PEZI|nr:hypothetical protein C8A04DRAFT_40044 [Dichotomopilus funicola]
MPKPTPTTIPQNPLSQSLTTPPPPSAGRIFLHSQFCTKPQRLSLTPSTTLTNQTALITGGNAGLGYHAARHLLSLNLSRLILAVRSPAKGEEAARVLRRDFPRARVEVWELEMGGYESVMGFVERVKGEFGNGNGNGKGDGEDAKGEKKKRLDMVILNAGMMGAEFMKDKQTGHCQVVQVNYLSTFLLAILLLPILRTTNTSTTGQQQNRKPGRLTIVSSGGVFAGAKLPNRGERPFLASFDTPPSPTQPFDVQERYFGSKALGHLFFVRLLPYLPPASEVIVNLVDPGFCKGTQLHREAEGFASAMWAVGKAVTGRSLEDGAWTYVDAVVAKGEESHGCFLMDWKIFGFYYAVYEPEGEELMDVLFEETMAELEFAGIRGILEGLKQK